MLYELWSYPASITPTPCCTEASKLISSGFSACRIKLRVWCLHVAGTKARRSFCAPYIGCLSRTESSTKSCCMFLNLFIILLQSTLLMLSLCTTKTQHVDCGPLLMPPGLLCHDRSVKLVTSHSTSVVLNCGTSSRCASERPRPCLLSKAF